MEKGAEEPTKEVDKAGIVTGKAAKVAENAGIVAEKVMKEAGTAGKVVAKGGENAVLNSNYISSIYTTKVGA